MFGHDGIELASVRVGKDELERNLVSSLECSKDQSVCFDDNVGANGPTTSLSS